MGANRLWPKSLQIERLIRKNKATLENIELNLKTLMEKEGLKYVEQDNQTRETEGNRSVSESSGKVQDKPNTSEREHRDVQETDGASDSNSL